MALAFIIVQSRAIVRFIHGLLIAEFGPLDAKFGMELVQLCAYTCMILAVNLNG